MGSFFVGLPLPTAAGGVDGMALLAPAAAPGSFSLFLDPAGRPLGLGWDWRGRCCCCWEEEEEDAGRGEKEEDRCLVDKGASSFTMAGPEIWQAIR